MNKRIRQYVGLLSAVLAYYLVHEGAHFVYAMSIGVFSGSILWGSVFKLPLSQSE